MIFTPTSWLMPRPTYKAFRQKWDQYFSYHSGFLITSNEFFELNGKWPLAFTIWSYQHNEAGNNNTVSVHDLTGLVKHQLNLNWNLEEEELNFQLNDLLLNGKVVKLDNTKEHINIWVNQSMYDFKRDATKQELASNQIYGGLPFKDERRSNKKTYGISNSSFIGFMDDVTPCRIKNNASNRMSNKPDRLWFQLRPTFIDVNLTKVQPGPSDKYAYCAYDLPSAQATCTWFAITKALNGRYPLWANQYDIWPPTIQPELENYWNALCFAFVLAENRCVVTKFEKDNPVAGAPEVYVDNPLCPTNKESFWSSTLASTFEGLGKDNTARLLAESVKELYRYWNINYCKAQVLENVGLQKEAYFRYFSYPDFLTPYSGLIQIRKYAEQKGLHDLLTRFDEISGYTKLAKEEIYRLLVGEFRYFE
jgi:hypothetical protein